MKTPLLLGLLLTALLSSGCRSAEADASTPEIVRVVVNQTVNFNGEVSFKGISFNYNPQIFDDIKLEEVEEQPLEGEDYKPNENFPKHIEFYLKNTEKSLESRIVVVPIEDYRRMYAVSKHYTELFDKNINDLRKVLKDKNFRSKGQIPIMPLYDAHQSFLAKVKHHSFQDGKGIFFLTQFDQEYSLVNNESLSYYYQGISADGKNYVIAVFSPKVSFLPKTSDFDKFENYEIPKFYPMSKSNVKKYEEYIVKITKRLEKLPPNEYEPDLRYFEEIISSLKIE